MMMPVSVAVKSDMLSMTSAVQEILRAMYLYSADYILLVVAKQERLLHKNQLIALLEQERDDVTLSELLSAELKDPLSTKMRIEEIPQETTLLLFALGELSQTTFGEYRQQKITAAATRLPEWWSVPLPLLYIKDDNISLNDSALALIPGGVKALANQIDRLLAERYITLNEKKTERTLTLTPLTDEVFFLEDISGDFEMAEDLVWWAAVGRAFVGRMEGNGLAVRRLSAYEDAPEGATEIIPCSWEGDLMGQLALILPGAEPAAEPAPAGEAQAERTEVTAEDVPQITPPDEPIKPAEMAAPPLTSAEEPRELLETPKKKRAVKRAAKPAPAEEGGNPAEKTGKRTSKRAAEDGAQPASTEEPPELPEAAEKPVSKLAASSGGI